jgi:hypothetical protein
MKTGKIILLLLLLILSSCNKDENYTGLENEINHEEKHQDYVTKHLSTNINTYLPNYNPQSSTSNLEVPIEMLRDIKSSIESMDTWDELSLVIQGYGTIRWNWSALNITNSEQYIVMLPIFDNNRITAILRYLHIDEHYHIEVITYGHIVDVTQNFTYYDITNDYLPYITMFNSLNIISNWTINTKMNDWISSYIKNNPNMIVNKNFLADATEEVCKFERTLKPFAGSDGIAYHIVFEKVCEDVAVQVNVPCGGGPPRPFPPFNRDTFNLNTIPPIPPMPPSPNGGENEGETEVKPEKEVMISDEECKKQKMTGKAAEFLENELQNMTFPCSELDHQGILDEIVQELCKKDSEENNGLDAADGSITMRDVEEVLGEYDWIEPTEAFKNCHKLNCILNNIRSNSKYCNLTEGFSNPLNTLTLDVNEDVGPHLGFYNNPRYRGVDAATWAYNSGSEVAIVFNPENCSPESEYTSVELLRDLLHEAIHAKMYNDCWPNGLSRDQYQEGFLACANAYYGIDLSGIDDRDQQHIVMANAFVNDIAKGIAAYLGVDNWADFTFLAWQGLSRYTDFDKEEWFQSEINESEENYSNLNFPINDPCQ